MLWSPFWTWALIPPASGILATMLSQLSNSRNCPQLKGAAQLTLLPLPRSSLHPMPDWCSAGAHPLSLNIVQSWRAIPALELPVRLAEASVVTASQLSFSLYPVRLPSPPLQVLSQVCSQSISGYTPACQNLLPKDHGQNQPLLAKNIWLEIWKMRRNQPCTGPGKEQRQRSLKQRGSFWISKITVGMLWRPHNSSWAIREDFLEEVLPELSIKDTRLKLFRSQFQSTWGRGFPTTTSNSWHQLGVL